MRVGVFIGRFQPFHSGHEHVVRDALTKVDKLLILVGSSFGARSSRNPWTLQERIEMIMSCFTWDVSQGRIIFEGTADYPSDERWITTIRNAVNDVTDDDDEISLVGFSKDKSSYYLNLFPDWGAVDIEPQWRALNATDVRISYFSSVQRIETSVLPGAVADYLNEWRLTDAYYAMHYEHEAIEHYKEAWKGAPFPPQFVTADAVVVQSGHVLLVRRGDYPGYGLLALPGGFVDEGETIREAAVRELIEETKISEKKTRAGRLSQGRLDSFIAETQVFDNPYRSTRGRTITHAHLFKLPDAKPLWTVRGGDDAATAKWYPIAKLHGSEFFEDHYHIIQDMLGL